MNILVTGATGYVGSAVADALLLAGHGVIGLARSEESARRLEKQGIRAVWGALTNPVEIEDAARGMAAVVHAATTHGDGAEEVDKATVEAVLNVLEDKVSQASGDRVLRYKRDLKRPLVRELQKLLAERMPYCRVRYAF